MIDLKEILINSNYKKETEELINIANLAYKHWETYWTGNLCLRRGFKRF